jgi:DNA-binding NtrC family response regulator
MQPVRLVLVEDMPMEAEIAVRHLESGGFACAWKRVDSEVGLRSVLREFKPDVILSDFTLPGFDGLTALDVSLELAPETPFIFLQAHSARRAIDALQRGAYDYVLKTNLARLVPAVHGHSVIQRSPRRRALNSSCGTSSPPAGLIWGHDRAANSPSV